VSEETALDSRQLGVDYTLGPISFKVLDIADMHTVLVTKIALSFIKNKIIPATMEAQVVDGMKAKIAA
jgi:hypothetical protein